MNKIISILIGLVFLVLPIYAWIAIPGGLWGFGDAALTFLKGGIMWMLMMIGALLLLMGIAGLKD